MDKASIANHHARTALSVALVSALFVAATGTSLAEDEKRKGRPYDKAFVASSAETSLLEARITEEGSTAEPVELLSTSVRIRPQDHGDLLIGFDAECGAILNEMDEQDEETPGNVLGASVSVWVELDGEPVPVSSGGAGPDDGTVVFCNADESTDFESQEPETTAAQLEATREARGFSWAAADVGKGTHEVVVKALLGISLDESEPPATTNVESDAMGLIGKRVLNVELANAAFPVPDEAE